MIPTRESTPRPEPGICGGGSCICGDPSASQSLWSESASDGAAFFFNFAVYVRDSLLCQAWDFSRHYCSSRHYCTCRTAQLVPRRFQAYSSTVESLSVELRGRVLPEPWPSRFGLRESRAAQRHEARTLHGAVQGSVASVSLVKSIRAVPSKNDAPPRQPRDLAEVLPKLASVLDMPRSARSLEEGRQLKGNTPMFSTAADQAGEGSSGSAAMPRCRAFYAPVNECLGVTTVGHQTRVQEDNSFWRVLELAATRKGKSPSPLRSFPNFAKGRRDGCWSPRRGQKRWIRTPARYVVPDLRDTRVRSEGQWPRSGLGLALAQTVRPRRSTIRPLVTRRSPSSYRLVQGSSRIRVSKEAADDAHWKRNAQAQERAPFRRRRRQLAKTDPCCGEPCPSSQTAGTGRQGRKGQRRRGKHRLGRDLYDAGPARIRGRARQFPQHQSRWPLFFS